MIYETTSLGTLSDLESCPDEFCKPATEFVKMYATDGVQIPGMSGALVINGCGVVGNHALKYAVQLLDGTDMVAGAQVMDIHLLLDLLSSEAAPRYRVDPSKVKSLLVLPTKSYCNLTHKGKDKY